MKRGLSDNFHTPAVEADGSGEQEDGADPSESPGTVKKRKLGVANQTYFQPGPMNSELKPWAL